MAKIRFDGITVSGDRGSVYVEVDANGNLHTTAVGATGVAQVIDADGNALVKDNFAYAAHESNTFTAVCLTGGACLAYAAAPSITNTSIPRITSTALAAIATVDRITLQCKDTIGASDSNHLGWLVMINAASEASAGTALTNALTVASGNDVMAYGVEMTPDAPLGNIQFIPVNSGVITIDLEMALTSVYVLPVALATTAVGVSALSIDLGVPV